MSRVRQLRDEIRYQQSIAPAQRETEVAIEYCQAALKCFDEYLTLAPSEERALALEAVYGEKAAKAMLASLK